MGYRDSQLEPLRRTIQPPTTRNPITRPEDLKGVPEQPIAITAEFVGEMDAALLISVSVNTLRWWRSAKRGPRFSKAGKLVRYSVSDLRAFMNGDAR
jgi:hypothetical protein